MKNKHSIKTIHYECEIYYQSLHIEQKCNVISLIKKIRLYDLKMVLFLYITSYFLLKIKVDCKTLIANNSCFSDDSTFSSN